MTLRKHKAERINLRKDIEAAFNDYESIFSHLHADSSDLDKKIEEVDSLIEHVNQRIYYAESRITRTVTFSITLLAIGAAFFAVIVKLEGLSFYLGIATTASLILTGTITSVIHVFQVNPKYPFRALGNDWKWFYPKIVDQEYRPSTIVMEGKEKYLKKRLLHVRGLREYARQIVSENKIERLKVDVQQLYLLHVNEKYKNYFLTALRRILTFGLFVTLILLISFFVAVINERRQVPGQPDKVILGEQIKPSTKKEKTPSDKPKFDQPLGKDRAEQIKPPMPKPAK